MVAEGWAPWRRPGPLEKAWDPPHPAEAITQGLQTKALYFLPPASQEFRFGTSVLSLEAHGCWSLASSHQGPTPWGFLLPNSPIKMLFS